MAPPHNKRRPRLRKDPKAPKRPRSAYILFCQDERERVKVSHPEMKPSEIMKLMGEAWKELPDSEKEKYNQDAQDDKQRFEAEMADYRPSEEFTRARKRELKRRGKRDPSEPKRGKSAYIFFGQVKRAQVKEENPTALSPEIMKIIGELWGKLTDAEKEPYEQMAKEDKARYEQDKAKWEHHQNAGDSEAEEEEEEDDEEDDDEDDEDDEDEE